VNTVTSRDGASLSSRADERLEPLAPSVAHVLADDALGERQSQLHYSVAVLGRRMEGDREHRADCEEFRGDGHEVREN
jgi:hypothetical protein